MEFYTLKNKSVLNKAGIYTQEQVDELQGRIEELWTQLNSAHASLMTYSESIKRFTNEDSCFSQELRMKTICEICDKLMAEGKECLKVMQADG